MSEVQNSPFDTAHPRLVVGELCAPRLEFVAQALEPRLPALTAVADHRRIDQQPLPSPRRAHGAFDHGNRVGDRTVDNRGLALDFEIRGERVGGKFSLRAYRSAAVSRGGRAVRVGHLGERKIFAETARGEILGGTS